jgi:hypothetical protein
MQHLKLELYRIKKKYGKKHLSIKMVKKIKKKYKVSFFSSDVGAELIGRGKGATYPLIGPKAGNEEILKAGEILIQPGSFVFIVHSQTGANHWAIYTEKGFLVHRSKGITTIGLKEFFLPLEQKAEPERKYGIYYLFGRHYPKIEEKYIVEQSPVGFIFKREYESSKEFGEKEMVEQRK